MSRACLREVPTHHGDGAWRSSIWRFSLETGGLETGVVSWDVPVATMCVDHDQQGVTIMGASDSLSRAAFPGWGWEAEIPQEIRCLKIFGPTMADFVI